MQVKCPHCGGIVNVVTRAPVGSGTRLGEKLKELNGNHLNVINALKKIGRPATVRGVQKRLYEDGIRRFTRQDFGGSVGICTPKDVDYQTGLWGGPLAGQMIVRPSGQWNYHYVQAILSILVGHGDVEMSAASTSFDRRQGMHDSKPVPTYWVK